MEILGLEPKTYREFLDKIEKNGAAEEIMKLDDKKREKCYSIVDDGIKKYLRRLTPSASGGLSNNSSASGGLSNSSSASGGVTNISSASGGVSNISSASGDLCLNFDVVQKTFDRQKDKIYLFCNAGVFSTCKYETFNIDKTRFSIKNNNTICLFDIDNIRTYNLLLRWKNRKGAGGPAWQISIQNVKSEKPTKGLPNSKKTEPLDISAISAEDNIVPASGGLSNITTLKSVARTLGIKGYSKYKTSNKNELYQLILDTSASGG